MPRTVLRRPVTVTVWVTLSVLVLVLSPVILLVGAIFSAVMHRPQPQIIARAMVAYFAAELSVLIAAAGLWVTSGCGRAIHSQRFQRLHMQLLGWFVRRAASQLISLFELRVRSQPTPEAAAALRADRPLLFFSRHAGPGDTVLLIDELMTRYGRHPCVVFKELLIIDPSVDVLAHRLPHAILDTSDAQECLARIATVSRELPWRGVLVLFPEGGNFTPQRRRKALRSLRRRGHTRAAREAQQMTHVMPPRPAGALAALASNPDADVLFSAHTGLGLSASVGDVWREVPTGCTFTNRIWLAPAAERPTDPEAQVEWLLGWWKRIDGWIAGQGEPVPTEPWPVAGGNPE